MSAANHALLYCRPMPTGRSAGQSNCRLTPDSSIQRTSWCSTDISARQTSNYTSDLSFIALYAGEMCGRIQGICLIGVERRSDIICCNWEHRLYEPLWEHSGRIAMLKYWVNVLCIVGSLKYTLCKTTRALKVFQKTQNWAPHCTYVAYFNTGVLLRTGTYETDVTKQTNVVDWWNWV